MDSAVLRVIIRKNLLWGFINQKDYHTVPEIFGRNKTLAELFEKNWKLKVGRCKLVFTRSIEGRKALLNARIQSLTTKVNKEIERQNRWT